MQQRLILAWVGFVLLMVGASPAHFWLDAGEIASAGSELGVMHPPGVPGFVPLLHLAGVVPLGSLGFRMSLVSSALGAVTVGIVVALLERRRAHVITCWGASLAILGAITFVQNARTLEIYTYGACLALFALWGLDPATPRPRRMHGRLVATLALTLGAWGFGDLRLLWVAGVALWLRGAWRKQSWCRWAPLCAVLASLPVLTLPLASARQPVADWGNPDNWARLWSHLQAESIRGAYAEQILPTTWGPWWLHLQANLGRLLEDVGPLTCLLAFGAFVGRRRSVMNRADRGLAGMLVLVAGVELAYAVGINPMGGRDRQTGLLLVVMVVALAGLSAHVWLSGRARAGWAILPLWWTLAAAPGWMREGDDLATTRSWAPHAWVRRVLSRVPPGTLLLTQSDDLSAGLVAARALEGARPDLSLVPAQHLYRPVPRHVSIGSPLYRGWTAASGERTETRRLEALLSSWGGPVAFEHAHTGVLRRLPALDLRWGIPMSLTHAPANWVAPSVQVDLEALIKPFGPAADRARIAVALSAYARGRVRASASPQVLAEAEHVLTSVVREVEPAHASAWVALGVIYDRFGRTARAIEVTRAALAIDVDRHAALTNLALYLSRDAHTLPRAAELALRAVSLRPHLASGWYRLADVRDIRGEKVAARAARRRADELSGREP
ncbi:MAG: DUF2723 domain-containing protein [Nannocystaceae bacterium]